MADHFIYQSPFSWRYGSEEMRQIWGLKQTRLLWRKIWVALAQAQVPYGLVSEEQAAELVQQQATLDLDRSLELEQELKHDLMAELQVFAEQCPEAGGILHLGATSMDIKDNALILQQKVALDLILTRLESLLDLLAGLIHQHAGRPVLGFTHLQPAEPTTLGYRLAQTGQDLLLGYLDLIDLKQGLKGKGMTGAVGTSGSFAVLLGEDQLAAFQAEMGRLLNLEFFTVVSQTYPRLQDYRLLSCLAGLGAALYKFAFDLRLLQSPSLGELSEPFGKEQVGSSAMPFKQNPIAAEKIDSLGRYLAQLPRTAWDNAAHSLLERTLDDSANRRIIIPEAFLCLEEMLLATEKILAGLEIHPAAVEANLAGYGPFAATENLLMALSRAGADRQAAHEIIRQFAIQAWNAVREGKQNPLIDLLAGEEEFLKYLKEDQIREILSGPISLGDAEKRAEALAERIRDTLPGT